MAARLKRKDIRSSAPTPITSKKSPTISYTNNNSLALLVHHVEINALANLQARLSASSFNLVLSLEDICITKKHRNDKTKGKHRLQNR